MISSTRNAHQEDRQHGCDGTKERRAKRRAHDSIFTVEVITGKAGDLDTVAEIVDEAANWVVSKGSKGWKPGSFSRQSLNEQLEQGEVYLGKIGGEIVGTITLQWSDRLFWGEILQEAG